MLTPPLDSADRRPSCDSLTDYAYLHQDGCGEWGHYVMIPLRIIYIYTSVINAAFNGLVMIPLRIIYIYT